MDIKSTPKELQKPRLAILQRVCPGYRTALFSSLSSDGGWEVQLFIGDNIPNSKVKSHADLQGVRHTKLKTRFITIGHRTFPWHEALVANLTTFKPDVILCEGESHFLGYLQAIWYKLFYNSNVALIHWCFISLPGDPLTKPGLAGKIKGFVRRFFDAHLLYSSYSRDRLKALGVPAEKMFVATNVGDVRKFLRHADSLSISPSEARANLHLPEKFTVLYTGTLDRNKRPEILVALAKICDVDKFNFVLLGEGEMLHELRRQVLSENLVNVFLPGRVTEEIAHYFRASNVLLVPGRGGIIISEGMSFSLPVIAYQADGTEHDLIKNGETGFILQSGTVTDFQRAIEYLETNPTIALQMGRSGRRLVEEQFTTTNMVNQIKKAASYARQKRKK